MTAVSLAALIAQRQELPAQGTTIYRGIHTTETGGAFALDITGPVGILSLYSELSPAQEAQLATECATAAHLEAVYIKRRPQEARHLANVEREHLSPNTPLWGTEQPELTVLEEGVPFLIRPSSDLSTGLFTDARTARAWVRQHAPARVLNTFAYTCGFGLNAVLGGAQTVKNVDLSRKVLSWGQENYALSGLNAPDTDFLYGDVFEWLHRLDKRGDEFDLVILDPPSFARSKAGVWRSEKDYARLAFQAARVTAQGGRLLALLNHAGVSPALFGRMVRLGLDEAGRRARLTESLPIGQDYPGGTHLKVQVWSLD